MFFKFFIKYNPFYSYISKLNQSVLQNPLVLMATKGNQGTKRVFPEN